MAQSLTPQLLEHSPDAVILFVTNPVDIVTFAATKAVAAAPGHVFGSGTVLDSSRFRYLIAEQADLAVGNVHGLIIGEHGDSEISLWSSVSVGECRPSSSAVTAWRCSTSGRAEASPRR